MANKKLEINGEVADKKFPITTTETIYDNLVAESFEKNMSMNLIINKLLLTWVNKRTKRIANIGDGKHFKNKRQ